MPLSVVTRGFSVGNVTRVALRGFYTGAAIAESVADTVTGGVGKRYPRWVLVNGKRYRVRNPEEERQLLRGQVEREQDQAKIAEALGDMEVAQVAKDRAVRIERRIEKVDTREAEWLAYLIEEDEAILLAL